MIMCSIALALRIIIILGSLDTTLRLYHLDLGLLCIVWYALQKKNKEVEAIHIFSVNESGKRGRDENNTKQRKGG